jgi:hypothetical protein
MDTRENDVLMTEAMNFLKEKFKTNTDKLQESST